MGQLHRIEETVLALGYQIIAISADKPENLRASIARHDLNYTLLSDSKAEAMRGLGIAFRAPDDLIARYKSNNMDLEAASGETHHILPAPSAFVVTPEGVVTFAYTNPNHRVRIDPDILLAAAKSALKE